MFKANYNSNNKLNLREEEVKMDYIQIRVSQEEKILIKKIAKLQHLSVSSLIRWLVLSKYKNDLIRDNS